MVGPLEVLEKFSVGWHRWKYGVAQVEIWWRHRWKYGMAQVEIWWSYDNRVSKVQVLNSFLF